MKVQSQRHAQKYDCIIQGKGVYAKVEIENIKDLDLVRKIISKIARLLSTQEKGSESRP